MPWRKITVIDEKIKFIGSYLENEFNLSHLTRIFGISRKTGYKWIQRYKEKGVDGLKDQNRAPHTHPTKVVLEIEEKIIQTKHLHPFWGPRKVIRYLQTKQDQTQWPSSSAAARILRRHGLVKSRPKRKTSEKYSTPHLSEGRLPNDVWTADFKGKFSMLGGTRVEPLTITDLSSRYLLKCQIIKSLSIDEVRKEFELTFREYGMPWVIRTDNGSPFASTGLGGLTRLSVWWIKLGISPERIKPGHPEQNGSHERMHRSLEEQTSKENFENPQTMFDKFRREFNEDRPHEYLEMNVPAQYYKHSERIFPEQLPEIGYDSSFIIRKVRNNGQIKWQGGKVYVSLSLIGEPVGLKEIDNDIWNLYFGSLPLATYDGRKKQIQPFVQKKNQLKKV